MFNCEVQDLLKLLACAGNPHWDDPLAEQFFSLWIDPLSAGWVKDGQAASDLPDELVPYLVVPQVDGPLTHDGRYEDLL